MMLFIFSLVIIVLSGIAAVFLNQSPQRATAVVLFGVIAGTIIGFIPVVNVFIHNASFSLSIPWDIPFGSFSIALDALSAFFLIPILLLSLLAVLYGSQYFKHWFGKKPIGVYWLFFTLLVVAMEMVVVARNAILFLFVWELMSLSSFFLVTFENEKEAVRRAGIIYLVAMHVGTAFLFIVFLLLSKAGGSFDFEHFRVVASEASLIFVLAVIGFGTKAGFFPFHVWLPEAHPVAPSPVSALMSGVMIKTGIYALIRTLTFLGMPLLWWSWLLIAIGIISGILGVMFALAQHDLKRLLAYSSIENIGIITLGLGVGILGVTLNIPLLTILGFSSSLLHVINHSLFKSLLFLGAGSVLHATGTKKIDQLGGLLKRMPWTGVTFCIGVFSLSGLPPLNGFISEFFLYKAALHGLLGSVSVMIYSLIIIAGLALIGGLASACFAKAFGMVFLGEPRTERVSHVKEAGFLMRVAMVVLAGFCVLMGMCVPVIVKIFMKVLPAITFFDQNVLETNFREVLHVSKYLSLGALAFWLCLGLVLLVRKLILKNRSVTRAVTWDCGYIQPAPRMQYTASSFAWPLIENFKVFLKSRRRVVPPQGIFPRDAALSTDTPDIAAEYLYQPLFHKMTQIFLRLKWFQHGRLQVYVLYIVATLLVLLIWKFW